MLLVQNFHAQLKINKVLITEPQIPWTDFRWKEDPLGLHDYAFMVDVLMHNPSLLLVWKIQASSFQLF
jgi:hypothetical protein